MPSALVLWVGILNSVMAPCVVIRPILLALTLNSVNQRAPSGPSEIRDGWLPCVGSGNSVTAPSVVMRPILLPRFSVNQRAPSGPAVIPSGFDPEVGTSNSRICCARASPPKKTAHASATRRVFILDGIGSSDYGLASRPEEPARKNGPEETAWELQFPGANSITFHLLPPFVLSATSNVAKATRT